MTDTIQLTADEIQQYRKELTGNAKALEDMDLIERCNGDLEYAAVRLVRRSKIDIIKADEDNFWQQAIIQARQLVCRDHIRNDLAPDILGGLVGLFISSSNPILGVLSTPLAIYVVKTRLENFCD
ncbi:MAG TPA: hypothetical protein DCF68_19810 [Cyanothece sp. UBA12306]|nr:hypothetical protein [Cyanothece sp. UBA12306]